MATPPSGITRLETLDYVILFSVVLLSLAIGLFYAWRSRKFTSTREFLVATRNIGVGPLVVSTFATALSPRSMLSTPSEVYANGAQMILPSLANFVSVLFSTYAILPVFFRLNVSTANQYIEYRFNRVLRTLIALLFVLQNSISVASLVQVTALIISDATGISFWWSIGIICGICVIYTSLGGFTGVIWTDVLQAGIIVTFMVAFVIKGTNDVGTLSEIWNRNIQGNRTVMFRMSLENESNYSFWSLVFGGFFMGLAASISQAPLQRQMANKTLRGAQMTRLFSRVGSVIAQSAFVWIGMINYARYFNCDPVLNKQVRSKDQITVLFATQIFNGTNGLWGLFLAGILAASLSTLSSVINSFSTVVIIDFCKVFIPRMPDKYMVLLSKILGFVYGALVVAMTQVVDRFGGIKQVTFIMNGASYGPIAGVFMLGFFFPWATTTGAFSGLLLALAFVWWAAIGRITNRIPYYTLPMRTDGCSSQNGITHSDGFNISETISSNVTVAVSRIISKSSDEVFALYMVNPLWYSMMAMGIVLFVGIGVSLITGHRDPELVNPRLISPFSWFVLRHLPVGWLKRLGIRSKKFHDDIWISIDMECSNVKVGTDERCTEELQKLKHKEIDSSNNMPEK